MLSASDVLQLVLEDDSDLSGSDSGEEEGPGIYAYRGPTLNPSVLREEAILDGVLSCKFVLDIALGSFCLPDSMEKIL